MAEDRKISFVGTFDGSQIKNEFANINKALKETISELKNETNAINNEITKSAEKQKKAIQDTTANRLKTLQDQYHETIKYYKDDFNTEQKFIKSKEDLNRTLSNLKKAYSKNVKNIEQENANKIKDIDRNLANEIKANNKALASTIATLQKQETTIEKQEASKQKSITKNIIKEKEQAEKDFAKTVDETNKAVLKEFEDKEKEKTRIAKEEEEKRAQLEKEQMQRATTLSNWQKHLDDERWKSQLQAIARTQQMNQKQNLMSSIKNSGIGRYASMGAVAAMTVKFWKDAFKKSLALSVNFYKSLYSGLKNLVGKVKDTISGLVSFVKEFVNRIIGLIQGIGDVAGALIEKFKSISSTVNEYAGALEVANNMVIQTFGEMDESVDRFCKGALNAYGLTEQQAKRSVALYATMGKSFGLAQDDAAEMAKTLTGLAADIAVFYGEDMEDAMAQVKSVFTGETETLKNVGVILTEANLEAYMLENNIKGSYQEMNSATKTLLRYCYVMENTTTAQGSFSKMSNTFYGQLRILQAQWETLMTSITTAMAKVLTPLLQIVTQLVINLQALSQELNGLLSEIFGLNSELGATTGYSDLYAGIEESATDAEDAVESMKQALAGVDTINTLSESGSNNGIDTSMYDDLLEKAKAISNYKIGDISKGSAKGIQYLKDALQWIKDRVDGIKESVSKIKGSVDFTPLINTWYGFADSFGKFFDTVSSWAIEDVFPWLVEDLLPTVNGILDKMTQNINNTFKSIDWSVVGDGIISIIDWLWTRIENCRKAFQYMFENVNWQPLIDGWNKFEPQLAKFIDWLFVKLAELTKWFIEDCLPHLEEMTVELLPLIASIIEAIDWQKISDFLISTIDKVKEIAKWLNDHQWAIDMIGKIITNIILALLQFKPILFTIQAFILSLLGPLQTIVLVVYNIGKIIGTAIGGAIKQVIELVDQLLEKLSKATNGISNGLVNAVTSIANPVGSAYNGAKNIFSNIPHFANGGVLTQPTLAIAGEYSGASSNPEIITPQSLMEETIQNTMGGYFGQMIGLLETIAAKDNNTYLDGKMISKEVTKQQNRDNWRRN